MLLSNDRAAELQRRSRMDERMNRKEERFRFAGAGFTTNTSRILYR
ncbi:MAG: hypothetical protein WDZ29_07950 [Balneolaceae bacterium]